MNILCPLKCSEHGFPTPSSLLYISSHLFAIPDNSHLYSVSLEGSSYQELTVYPNYCVLILLIKKFNNVFVLKFQSSVGLIQVITLTSVAAEFMAVKRQEKETA